MGPVAYSLCHKEVIGVAMWITGLCSFPPLIAPTEIALQEPGVVLRKDFNAPVDKSYLLGLRFVFPSSDARLKDELVGDGRHGKYCRGDIEYESIPLNERKGLGLPIPLKVVVRKQPEGTLVMEQTFQSLCKTFHATNDKGRSVGRINLKEGAYRIEVSNQLAQPAFKDLKVEISLVSGDAK